MALMNTYGDRSTTLVKGDGPYLWDAGGRRYLDALSGIAVCGLGYNFPSVTRAICNQAQTLIHASNLYHTEPQQALAKVLTKISGMESAFFCNSGAEANEAAIKIARKFGQEKGIKTPRIVTTESSFHGRTLATLSATGNTKVKKGFEPLVDGFLHVPFNDIESIERAASDDIVAIMVEPVQGEGGVHVPAPDYLARLRKLCDLKGWLLILDEIQTGNGRTGRYFAFQHDSILPDVVTTAKGLGNGVPIGACLARGQAASVLQPGNHGSTFGGNPLACSAALAVIDALASEGYMERAAELGRRMVEQFKLALAEVAIVKEVRGKGLMIGIELDKDCGEIVERAKQQNLLINVTAGRNIRLLPPLIINDDEAHTIVDTVVSLIKAF